MGKTLDLRERAVAAVEIEALSYHQAAAQFGIGASTRRLGAASAWDRQRCAGADGRRAQAEGHFG
jgi:transposase